MRSGNSSRSLANRTPLFCDAQHRRGSTPSPQRRPSGKRRFASRISFRPCPCRQDRARAPRLRAEQDTLIVRYFNARLLAKRSAGFWPTTATALASKHFWLRVLCDSCGVITDLDLSMNPRDAEASVRVALRNVRCIRCNGHGRPRGTGLSRHPSMAGFNSTCIGAFTSAALAMSCARDHH
jgi:hypothetical protein